METKERKRRREGECRARCAVGDRSEIEEVEDRETGAANGAISDDVAFRPASMSARQQATSTPPARRVSWYRTRSCKKTPNLLASASHLAWPPPRPSHPHPPHPPPHPRQHPARPSPTLSCNHKPRPRAPPRPHSQTRSRRAKSCSLRRPCTGSVPGTGTGRRWTRC